MFIMLLRKIEMNDCLAPVGQSLFVNRSSSFGNRHSGIIYQKKTPYRLQLTIIGIIELMHGRRGRGPVGTTFLDFKG